MNDFEVCCGVQVGLITAFAFFRTRLHPDSVTEGNDYFSVVFFSLVSFTTADDYEQDDAYMRGGLSILCVADHDHV